MCVQEILQSYRFGMIWVMVRTLHFLGKLSLQTSGTSVCYRVLMHCHDGSVQKRTRRLWSSVSATCFPEAEAANARILSLSFSSGPSPALHHTNIHFRIFLHHQIMKYNNKLTYQKYYIYLLSPPSVSFGFFSALAQSNTNGSLSEKCQKKTNITFFFLHEYKKLKQGANTQYREIIKYAKISMMKIS